VKRIASITAAALLFSALVVQAGTGSVAASSSSRAQVKTAFNQKIGKKILVDGAGRTLYMFTTDTRGKDHGLHPVRAVRRGVPSDLAGAHELGQAARGQGREGFAPDRVQAQ
jgi:hypothetical protein